MENQRELRNYTGQTPSNVPSEELINPRKGKGVKKKVDRKSNYNTTAKNSNLGSREDKGR